MTRSSFSWCRSAALGLCAALPLAGQAADPPAWPDPVSSPAERMPLAARSLLLDALRAGDGYLVVGDRGHVLRSADGRDWTQSEVPVRVLLTAATARGDSVWAVGHDGVIVHSADGGVHWNVQHRDSYEDGAAAAADPRHGAPLLDVLFVDDRHGIAVGAYSRMLVTRDGGASWQPETLAVAPANASKEPAAAAPAPAGASPAADAAQDGEDGSMVFSEDELALGEESDPHLNAIVRTGSGGLMILAERGSAFRSRDGGDTWQRIQLPYDGSMFGAIGYAGDRVLAFGLRGNVFETGDLGESWTRRASGTEQGLMGGSALDGEGAVLVGANGVVLMRRSADAPFETMAQPGAGVLAGAVALDGRRLLLVGENGVGEVELP
ncbi:MAG TPA: hypothetical protein VMR06_08700 [Dokdonella sp.]|uniref:WD40/YVTN/BNR-like repeat-containing protein n=1 Tax=Dokdonella sp. TaxID=2291710 RepID=UPI002D0B1986|nr:hypothetical protein [Dokdonella sp.]HUD42060.1 hypothetical protein [Dokdonella sp.]